MASALSRLSIRTLQCSRASLVTALHRLRVSSQSSATHSHLPIFALAAVSSTAIAYSLLPTNAECFVDDDEDNDPKIKRKVDLPLTRNFVADVVEAVSPAVVNIICTSNGYIPSSSSGSGFIINKEGFIVTNAHVIGNGDADAIIVTMKSGMKRRASLHAMDISSDLALIKLEDVEGGEDLPVAPLGQSATVRAGEFVIAIGSPMLLQNSASLGIISATARHASELGISNNRSEYLQTDAAVNVGNSGGPLVNLNGEVIGINTLKVKGTDGISLAIPIDIASQIVKQLLLYRKVTRPFVGLKMAEMLTSSDSDAVGGFRRRSTSSSKFKSGLLLEKPKVVVLDVQRFSPAANAGLER
jgi:S1-C subfamily serine protease